MLRPEFPITTPRLRLRPFVADDLDALHKIQSRDDVAKFLYWGPRTREETAAALAGRLEMTTLEAEGDTLLLAVTVDGELIGDVNLQWHSVEHRGGEIGFVLHPDHHGRGYATEAAREMLRLGFEGLGLHRITGRLDADNHASARVLAKLGMRREAHFRANEYVKGRWADEAVYAMLAEEWRGLPSATR
ncbi:GNAT family N-acetyltransferase [Actinokineospora sp. 24-640]